MICIHCDEEFNHNHPRQKSKGKINECVDCAEDVVKTIGVIDAVGKTDLRLTLQRNPKPDRDTTFQL